MYPEEEESKKRHQKEDLLTGRTNEKRNEEGIRSNGQQSVGM
jgi:hypothetical protein